jgi:inorganic pyrophosphatase
VIAVFLDLPPRPKRSGLVHVVIDTPKGSRNKYKFDPALGCFGLSRISPIGAVFPWDAVHSLSQLGAGVLDEVEHFFESYNRAQGRTFKPGGRLGAVAADQLVRRALLPTRSADR